jgi:hypothetical protein
MMEWFRWYHGTVSDPKLILIARVSNQPRVAVLSVWQYLLEYASENTDRGSLEGLDHEVMSVTLDLEIEDIVTICHAMSQKKIIGHDRVLNWEKRQPKREDETATDRKRNQREREKLEKQVSDLKADLENVTQCHDVSHNVTSIDRTEQIDLKEGVPHNLEDIIWKLGINILTSAGQSERNARTYLGKQCKNNKEKLAQVISQIAVNHPVDPVAYIEKAMQHKKLQVCL